MWKDFKAFIMRGNVMDLAVGIIIGAAFGKIVSSLVNDIFMPVIGLAFGKINFANLFINLSGTKYDSLAAAQAAGAPTINYGLFLINIIDLLIIALVVFLLIRALSKLTKKPEKPAEPTTKECPHCLSTINIKATRCPNCTSELK
jgi:large conductance mechanosensitive channel